MSKETVMRLVNFAFDGKDARCPQWSEQKNPDDVNLGTTIICYSLNKGDFVLVLRTMFGRGERRGRRLQGLGGKASLFPHGRGNARFCRTHQVQVVLDLHFLAGLYSNAYI